MRTILALLTVVALPVLLGAQAPAPAAQDERPRFEVASIKPNTSTSAGINNSGSGPGRFAYVNTPLAVFIRNAYGFPAERVLGVPDWALRDKYDITATHDAKYPAFGRQQNAMLQRLLEERFSLQTHREMREMPVYELVRVRADGYGPRLRPPAPECAPGGTAERSQCGTRINMGLIDGRFVDWRMVTSQLPSAVGRTVIDKTGLQGMFDVKFEWRPDPGVMKSPEAVAGATAAAATPGERVDIATALQEQLGVRLQPARAPLEVLVIDRLERPTPD
jgi:uncharacterized protein (TIGR03435 family)